MDINPGRLLPSLMCLNVLMKNDSPERIFSHYGAGLKEPFIEYYVRSRSVRIFSLWEPRFTFLFGFWNQLFMILNCRNKSDYEIITSVYR